MLYGLDGNAFGDWVIMQAGDNAGELLSAEWDDNATTNDRDSTADCEGGAITSPQGWVGMNRVGEGTVKRNREGDFAEGGHEWTLPSIAKCEGGCRLCGPNFFDLDIKLIDEGLQAGGDLCNLIAGDYSVTCNAGGAVCKSCNLLNIPAYLN